MVKETTFIVDAMFGSLARWLRLLGFDTLYCPTQSDDEILDEINSRILVTRDGELIDRARKQGFQVVNPGIGAIRDMLQRIKQELKINFVVDPTQSRCAQCNSLLLERTRSQVQNFVPSGSLRNHDTFWQCTNPSCKQVYWQGRHWTRIKKTVKQI